MLDHELFGTNPSGHHLTSLFFHIVNTLLLFAVLRRATKTLWQSAFVAALFAIHPLHVASVAWVSERKDVLSTFFWILTMICYVWYAEQPSIWRYLLTLLILALGLMAKPMLVTLPLVLLLLDYWPLERLQIKNLFRLILEKVPLLILSAVSSIITLAAQKEVVVAVSSLPLSIRLANSLLSYAKYIGKMFIPSHLAFYYPHPSGYISYLRAVGAAVLLLVVSILIFKKSLRYKYLPVGWCWYLGTLVPVIGLVQVGEQAIADRYTYIPLIGLFIIVAWGITDLLSGWKYRNRVLAVVAPLVILFLSVTSYVQTSFWRNTVALFEHATQVTDGNYLVHHFLGQYFLKQGEFDKVIYHESQALLIEPDFPQAYNSIGLALVRKGKLPEAVVLFKRTIQMKPDYAEAYSNAGGALLDLGRYDEAMPYLITAITLDSNIAEAHYNLGIIYAKRGSLDKAVEHLTKTIQLNSGLAKAYSNLGTVLAQQGKLDDAVLNLEQALRLDPDNTQAQQNLNIVLASRNENSNTQSESGLGK
jgi:tetratricopeptide (TPR) repeat protein